MFLPGASVLFFLAVTNICYALSLDAYQKSMGELVRGELESRKAQPTKDRYESYQILMGAKSVYDDDFASSRTDENIDKYLKVSNAWMDRISNFWQGQDDILTTPVIIDDRPSKRPPTLSMDDQEDVEVFDPTIPDLSVRVPSGDDLSHLDESIPTNEWLKKCLEIFNQFAENGEKTKLDDSDVRWKLNEIPPLYRKFRTLLQERPDIIDTNVGKGLWNLAVQYYERLRHITLVKNFKSGASKLRDNGSGLSNGAEEYREYVKIPRSGPTIVNNAHNIAASA